MTADLRREEIARIAERHFPDETKRESVGYVMCAICPQTWPCDAAILLRSQDTATARIAAYEKAVTDFLIAFGSAPGRMATSMDEATWVALYNSVEALRAVLSGETRTGGETA